MKKPIKAIIVGAIALTLFSANYLINTDDPRVELANTYTVNGASETYISGIDDNNHHIAIELGEFGLNDLQVGDELKVTIFVDKILSVKEINK